MVSEVGGSGSRARRLYGRAADVAAVADDSQRKALLAGVAVLIAIAILALPVLHASPAPLTSDESLYLAEGYNIAKGNGPTYTSGEIVTHRPPLFPALLAAPIRITSDADAAYVVPKAVMLALVAATFLVASQAFGKAAGAIAALLVASSAFLRWLGTSLFLDGTETLFMLLTLAALMRAFRDESILWFAAAGLLFGTAFWTKEAAVLWLALPVVFALLSPEAHSGRIARGIAAYLAVACAATAAWWVWVYLATDSVYLWGKPDIALAALAIAALAAGALATLGWRITKRHAPGHVDGLLRWYGTALAGTCVAASLIGLEVAASWPYPRDYLTNVPQYLVDIAAPNTPPWPLVAAGLAWLAWRATKDPHARLLALAFALFLPFALHATNRSLSYRDALPLVYLGYIAAGGLAVALLRSASQQTQLIATGAAVAGLTLFGMLQTQYLNDDWLSYDGESVNDANWDNPLARDTARWLHENAPPGAGIMSSRLYFSQLYVLDEAAHSVHQLPTVRVTPRAGEQPFLEPESTLFRWEDSRLDRSAASDWLYVQRFPAKDYYVALAQGDMLRDIDERRIEYVVVTGDDAAFSSLSYLDYFERHRAFELVYADRRDATNGAYVFRVDRTRLAPIDYQAAVDVTTLRAIANDAGLSLDEASRAIDADGVTVR